ncbi:hypothetical protein UAJ10_14835 [Nitrospirillum sp. BR 11164]|uniref:hypothetical protein n=1 Tax=Nitrospirillum sp. BR 11164 TaxID=3104324 RepID=UPI002AFF7008|nr:hypothetical protein [Nitrospirillum sp. BR 11164]MEA1650283.1 hypothetical protein [Nitrospirillum sp. BR 11164]
MTTRTVNAAHSTDTAGLADRLAAILPRAAAVVETTGMLAVAAVIALCINAML